MKKIVFAVSTLLIFAGSQAFSQSLDEVLKNHFEAIGQEKLMTTTSTQAIGKIVQMGLEIPMIQTTAKPDKMRVEGTFQGLTFIQAYDGVEGWSINPFAGINEPEAMGQDELKAIKAQSVYEGQLWNPAERGFKVSYEGTQEVEGTPCHHIKLVAEGGDEYHHFIDAESYLPLKLTSKVTVQGVMMESDTFMGNYQQKNGIAYPGKIETMMGGQVVNTIVIDSLVFDKDLSADFFTKPKK